VILDGILVLMVIVAVIAHNHPIQANAETQYSQQVILNATSEGIVDPSQANAVADTTQVISNSVTVDDITLAAMLAAENAALTSPQYLTVLPIITR
jgi:hypothetical protein